MEAFVLLFVQVPAAPAVVSLITTDMPVHNVAGPDIAFGAILTVIVTVEYQPPVV